jgi:hypothetical protein
MAADWPADEVDANDGVAPSSDRRGIKTLQTARLHVILDNAHAGPATRIQSDHRGCWTGALTPAAGLALALHPGRFVSRLGLSAVLDGLETVALSAVENDRDQALTISKAVWDRARLAQERLDLPTADAICKRVRLSWRRALALALAEASRRTTLLGQWDSSHAAEWGDDGPELAVRALKAVTARIGRIPAAFEYDYEVRAIEMESQRRKAWKPLRLPLSSYVLSTFGTWNTALVASGIALPRAGQRRHPTPTLAESLDRCIDHVGVLPTSEYFLEWCARMDIPTPRLRGWAGVVDEVRARRQSRGAATPDRVTPAKVSPSLPTSVVRRRRAAFLHSREEVLASLRRYGKLHLAAGDLPRQRHYLLACREDPELIWPATIGRLGRFHDLCREAGIE